MLFLSPQERHEWVRYATEVLRDDSPPGYCDEAIRQNLVPAFHFYIAALLAATGAGDRSVGWLETGALCEEDSVLTCEYFLGFLKRHQERLVIPAEVFKDSRPFMHFAGTPIMKESRHQFIRQCGHSLPAFDQPIGFIDIGCGDGGLTLGMLSHLIGTGKVPGVREVVLVDPSPAMTGIAQATVGSAFPDTVVRVENCRIQEYSERIDHPFDIAMSSFAYHHMPVEEKRIDLSRLKPWIDHFLLFEIDANHDSPELYSPELALSVYQSYGRIIGFVSAHDAPPEVITGCIDSFLMTEIVSILTEPRGFRSDYHMLRSEWNALFRETLGPEFSLRSDSSCYADEYMQIFTLHYGRDRE